MNCSALSSWWDLPLHDPASRSTTYVLVDTSPRLTHKPKTTNNIGRNPLALAVDDTSSVSTGFADVPAVPPVIGFPLAICSPGFPPVILSSVAVLVSSNTGVVELVITLVCMGVLESIAESATDLDVGGASSERPSSAVMIA